MALEFAGSSTNVVGFGSGSSLDDISAGTAFALVYIDTVSADSGIVTKMPNDFVGHSLIYLGSSGFGVDLSRGAGNASLRALSDTGFTVASQWQWLVTCWDRGGVVGDQQCYHGTLTSPVSEVTYTDQRLGDTGNAIVSDASSDLGIGNIAGNPQTWYVMDGRIATVIIYDKRLTLAQMIQQQFTTTSPVTTNCVFFSHLGIHGTGGTGTQRDWAGGHTGTVTGATQVDHAPVSIFELPTFVLPPSSSASTQTVSLNSLTLSSSAEDISASPGEVSLALNELTLSSSTLSLSVLPGAVSLLLDELTLASSTLTLNATVGALSITLSTLTLTGSASGLSVDPGAVALVLSELTLAVSAEGLIVSPGAVALALNSLTLASSTTALSLTSGGASILLNSLSLSASAEGLTVIPGAVSIALSSVTLASSAESITAVISAATLVVTLSTLTLASSTEDLVISPGAVQVALNELTLASSAESLSLAGLSIIAIALTLKNRDISLALKDRDISFTVKTDG